MNHIPLFIGIIFLLSIGVVLLGWWQERRFLRRPASRQLEPNTLILSGLSFLSILVLIISAIFLFWELR